MAQFQRCGQQAWLQVIEDQYVKVSLPQDRFPEPLLSSCSGLSGRWFSPHSRSSLLAGGGALKSRKPSPDSLNL